jgi:uncharacterized protein (DUF1778 family)
MLYLLLYGRDRLEVYFMSRSAAKTEYVVLRVSPADLVAIKIAAAREGLTLSQFARGSMLAIMATSVDAHALRCLLDGITDSVVEALAHLKSKKVVVVR